MTRPPGQSESDDITAATAALRREARDVHAWSNGPHDVYAEHSHPYAKSLVCVRGSIEFRIADGRTLRLGPGDRMRLEPDSRHSAVVGPDGVTCVEGKQGPRGRAGGASERGE